MIRIDDDAVVRGLTHPAWRLYHAALGYSRQEGVGEVLTVAVATSIARTERVQPKAVQELLDAGLWEAIEGGFRQLRFHGASSKTSTNRVRAMRLRRSQERRETVSPRFNETHETVSSPARVIELPIQPITVNLYEQPSSVVTSDEGSNEPDRRAAISAWWHTRTGKFPMKRDVDAIANLKLPLPELIAAMDELWTAKDGNITEIAYFWRPMQDRENAALKGEGTPRGQGFRRVGPAGSAPAGRATR